MTPRFLPLLTLALVAFAADDDDAVRDRIYPRSGPPVAAYEVVSEGAEEITFKVTAQAAPSKRKSREVVRIAYAGMAEGSFKTGFDHLAAGRNTEAAAAFASGAEGGKEWQRVYGAMWSGDALERAGKFADAAAAFAIVAEGPAFEAHRLRLDAIYRQGFALALAKNPAADKVIATLTDLSKGRVGPPAEARANAIRCAAAIAKDPAAKIDDLARKAALRADETETWYHFNRWLAATFRTQNKAREAARTVEGMLSAIEKDPALGDADRLVELRLLKGTLQADTDPQAAILELLKIDLLPAGTIDQQCEARFLAGKLLLAEAKALEAQPDTAKDEKKRSFVTEQRATAKHLLAAAAASASTKPAKDEAAKLAATLP
jgi:hypothetical protein